MPLTVASVGYPLAKVSPATAGGAEQVLLAVDRGLVAAGYRSIVVAPAGSRCCGLLVPVRTPTTNLNENAKREAQRSFQEALTRVLERYEVDIVHMHGMDFDRYLPGEEIPVVVSLHLPLAWYNQEALRHTRPPVSLIAVSFAQARTAPRDVTIQTTIPNGVDLAGFPRLRHKGGYALILGRICPEKGVHLALDAAKRAKIPVILAGTVFDYAEHQSYFQEMVRPRLTANVRFIGAVGGERKAHLLAGARCLLIASLAPETSCLVAMEALAAGTPVIAWPSGALTEIVREGWTGFLVSTVEQMAEAIASVPAIDPQCCRWEAAQRFSSQAMISGYRAHYEELVVARSALGCRAA